jgi:tetratricopeptide (TPR) repeat protein
MLDSAAGARVSAGEAQQGIPPGALLFFCLSCFILLAVPCRPAPAASLGQAQRALQIQGAHYGTLPDADPAVVRTRAIFRKLTRVAGAPGGTLTLHVLATPKLIAQAYDQGVIIVSRGLVQRFDGDDDALAFILGHEIAHQVRGHHALLLGFGVQAPPAASLSGTVRTDQAKAFQVVELDADRFGALYTSLAGYRVQPTIAAIQTVAEALGSDPFHPDPARRAREIRRQIAEVLDHHEVYLLGLACLAMGRLEVAARIFEDFQNIYPGREVFLNLGMAYHKMALRYAPDDGFQRSILIDPRSRIIATLKGPEQPAHPLFRQYLERATEAYRQAVGMDPEDPVSHNNLGVAYLDGGQLEYALGEFRAALQADATFEAALNNRGIAQAKVGDLKRAEADFLEAAARSPQREAPFRNLAAVYGRMGNLAEARKAEEVLARLARGRVPGSVSPGPPSVGGLRLGMPWASAEEVLGASSPRAIAVPLSVTPGDELQLYPVRARGLAVAVERDAVSAIGVLERGAAGLPGYVDLGASTDRLQQAFGTPGGNEAAREVSLWTYPNHGLVVSVVNRKVAGLWVIRGSVK